MKKKRMVRIILILTVVGTLVSAEQVSSQSVFTAKNSMDFGMLPARPLSLAGAAPRSGEVSRNFLAVAADTIETRAVATDTLETADLQVEEEKGPGVVKQFAIFAILAGAAAYAVITLIQSDDSQKQSTSGGSGKPTPRASRGAFVSIPLTRSP